jgi:hypothetical protein
MVCRSVLGVLVAVLSVWTAAASFPASEFGITYRLRDGTKIHLFVFHGKLRAGFGGDIWYIDGTRIKNRSGHYLAYDLTGKDRRVFLVARPGKNAEWIDLTIPIGGKSKYDVEGYIGHFKAANGILAGQYLRLRVIWPADKGGKQTGPIYQVIISNDKALPLATAWREVSHG